MTIVLFFVVAIKFPLFIKKLKKKLVAKIYQKVFENGQEKLLISKKNLRFISISPKYERVFTKYHPGITSVSWENLATWKI